MTTWAYVPGTVLVGITDTLPAKAQRLDTLEWVADVEQWAQACGYWDTSSPTVLSDIQRAQAWRPALTNEQFVQLVTDFTAARDRRQDRRDYVEARALEWAQAKGTLVDWSDGIPPYVVPDNGPMPTGPDTLATLKAQVLWMYGRLDPRQQYIYDQEKRLTDVLVPMGDFVFALAEALIAELEQSETFHPPGTIL